VSRQLALPFVHRRHFSAAGFVAGEANAAARAWLADPARWPGGRLAVHGEAGTGKTHLLHAFAERHAGILLPGEAVRYLIDLPEAGVVAIDDADAAPEPEALLHLLNAASEAGLPVLLAGRLPPARWQAGLPDLASRLRAVTAVGVGLPDDELLAALLARLIAERQLRVDEAVQAYLLARLPRTGAALREAACRLDRASLALGRRVTRSTAVMVLAEMGLAADAGPGEYPETVSHGNGALL
jgi:chromosomal replication initiation ATPase DnaA